MKWTLPLLILLGTSAPAVARLDPRIQACEAVEIQQGSWAVDFRNLLDKNSTDRGGRVDASFIEDINFALVSAKEFVHTNIQFIQRAGFRGGEPSVGQCKRVTAIARTQIESYARHLISEVHPSDHELRYAYRDEFRQHLEASSDELQGY
jgi:hypothetical protein